MNINVKPHTIILLIGASNSGKTYFAEHTLIPQLSALPPLPNTNRVNVQHISSDNIRRELLGDPGAHKYSAAMANVSGQAFDVLRQRLRSATTFPTNAEFVIVDTKGTHEPFIREVAGIAREANYHVLPIIFQYSDIAVHYENIPENVGKTITRDLRKIKLDVRRVLANLRLTAVTVKDRTAEFVVNCPEHADLAKLIVSNDHELLVVGDVHGCYDELVDILALNGVTVDVNGLIVENTYGKHVVIAGDYVDKGPKVAECINFVHTNIDNPLFSVVVGNHEHRLAGELDGTITPLAGELGSFFDTHDRIVDDQAVVDKFVEVHRKSVPWVMNDYAVVTHAPCSVKHLGKIDAKSRRAARYISYQLNRDNIAEIVNELVSGDVGLVKHIFGHIPTSTPGERVDNRILVDGGCVGGGQLCSVAITKTRRVYVNTVKSSMPSTGPLIRYGGLKTQAPLAPDVLKRVTRQAKRGVNFISGTMTPTPVHNGELETIAAAVDFFKNAGVVDVVAQPKFMGSRANVYLHRTVEDCYTVSRNGFVVSEKIDLTAVYQAQIDRIFAKPEFADAKVVVLDGELMPWSTLGAGLVDVYRKTGADARADAEFIKSSGLELRLAAAKAKLNATNFNVDRHQTPKKELIANYGHGDYEQFNALANMETYIPADERLAGLDVFDEQLDIYGTAAPASYEPFAVLKVVLNNGTEVVPVLDGRWTNHEMFNLVNVAGCQRFNLDDEADVAKLNAYFAEVTEVGHLEGVVLKPNDCTLTNVLPYMKVRNPRYLTLVYGHDYLTAVKHDRLVARKSIKRKSRVSAQEWALGRRMLATPLAKVSADNAEFVALLAEFATLDDKSASIDPRL